MAGDDTKALSAAEQARKDSEGLVERLSRISFVGDVRPDITKADPDLLDPPGDETDGDE